jgi:hypothetical protein
MLVVFMLSVVMLTVTIVFIIKHSAIMLVVFMRVIVLTVISLSVKIVIAIMQSTIMLVVFMLSVIMLTVISLKCQNGE